MQRREERGLRPFLVDGPAADDDLAEPGLLHESRVPRRRGPLRGIDLLDVVHEIEADSFRGAGVERGEDTGRSVGRDLLGAVEPRVPEQADHEIAALRDAAVLRGDRRLVNPFLQALDRLVVAFLDFCQDTIGPGRGGARARGQGESRGAGQGAPDQCSSVHAQSLNRFFERSVGGRPRRGPGCFFAGAAGWGRPALSFPRSTAPRFAGGLFCRTVFSGKGSRGSGPVPGLSSRRSGAPREPPEVAAFQGSGV